MNDIALYERFFTSTLGRADRPGKVLKPFRSGKIAALLPVAP
ncbi:MAG: hypothetical protein ACP5OP_05530 [Leptospirillia bacterium]